jgi:GT2 family glycosyltransferase
MENKKNLGYAGAIMLYSKFIVNGVIVFLLNNDVNPKRCS